MPKSKEQIDRVFLDFSKTVERVPHERLLLNQHLTGVSGHLLSWIQDFLTGRTQQVILEEEQQPIQWSFRSFAGYYAWSPLTSGVYKRPDGLCFNWNSPFRRWMFFIPAHQIQGRCHYPPAGPHQPPEIVIIIYYYYYYYVGQSVVLCAHSLGNFREEGLRYRNSPFTLVCLLKDDLSIKETRQTPTRGYKHQAGNNQSLS